MPVDSPDFDEDFTDDNDLDNDFDPADEYPEDPDLDDGDESDEDDELSGLEVEELNMVSVGGSSNPLTSEQAMQVASFRREELSINPDDHAIRLNEFMCEFCFLVKRVTQRASGRSNVCIDCR